MNSPMLEVNNLKKYYPIKNGLFNRTIGQVKAVDDISFSIARGTTLCLVGESGSGKTTAGKTILRLHDRTGGQVIVDGVDIFLLSKKELRKKRPVMQLIFQDPYASLSPRMPCAEIIGEAVREHRIVSSREYDDYINHIMASCGLHPYQKDRYPHEFSGGQRQRICVARALALKPSFIVCDEPVSALDVSVQAQIINLLMDLQGLYALTYLFISHDLSVVRYIADTVGVMYLGNIVEFSAKERIFIRPLHPYTQALFSAVPIPDPMAKRQRTVLEGNIPSPANPPDGCKFHTRCRYKKTRCKEEAPALLEAEPGQMVACHQYN